MIAVAPDPTATAECPIHCAGDANRQSLQSACEPMGIVCFHDEVEVVVLDTEVDEMKARCGRGSEGRLNGGKRDPAQGRDLSVGSQRDVHWTSRIVSITTVMREAATARRRLASGSVATTAPRRA